MTVRFPGCLGSLPSRALAETQPSLLLENADAVVADAGPIRSYSAGSERVDYSQREGVGGIADPKSEADNLRDDLKRGEPDRPPHYGQL